MLPAMVPGFLAPVNVVIEFMTRLAWLGVPTKATSMANASPTSDEMVWLPARMRGRAGYRQHDVLNRDQRASQPDVNRVIRVTRPIQLVT